MAGIRGLAGDAVTVSLLPYGYLDSYLAGPLLGSCAAWSLLAPARSGAELF